MPPRASREAIRATPRVHQRRNPGEKRQGQRPAAGFGKTYVVQKGESPYTIAEKLKVDAAALLKLNGIDDPKKLKPGQTLHVPAATHPKTK